MNHIKAIVGTLAAAALLGGAQLSHALPALTLSGVDCNASLDNLKIDTIVKQDGTDAMALVDANQGNVAPAISSNACYGVFEGNDSQYLTEGMAPGEVWQNIGIRDEGFLNIAEYFPPNGAFTSPEELQDIAGDGTADDPGWIYAGKKDVEGPADDENGSIRSGSGDALYTFDIGTLLRLECTGDEGACNQGRFYYTPPAQNPPILAEILGDDFYFSEVSIVFKTSNEFAIFNFDIDDVGLPPVLGDGFNYAFGGSWTTAGLFENKNGKAQEYSHVSFWIKDPQATESQVPGPAPLALLIIGLGLLGARKRLTRTV